MSISLESQRHLLIERLAKSPELSRFAIQQRALPAIRLVTRAASMRVGQTRIGGMPDAPSGFVWPHWNRPAKAISKYLPFIGHPRSVPLAFIAQIELSAMPRVGDLLPSTGWLYFFYDLTSQPWGFDPADRGAWRVLYEDCDLSTLRTIEPPVALERQHRARGCAIETEPFLSLPDEVDGMEFATPECDAYEKLKEQFSAKGPAVHQLLGQPALIQNPMELECQLASNGIYCGDSKSYESQQAAALAPGASDWRLLLQIDTDEDGPGWMWGDLGRIYFWIREQDLRARRFENVWLILQCF